MKQFLKEAIKDILLFTITIFVYNTLIILIFADLKFVNTRFDMIKDFFQFIFSGEILNYPNFLGIFVIFIGIPAIIIRRVSNRLSNKLNFILMPLMIIVVSLLILPFIYILIFQIKFPLTKFLEDLLNLYVFTSVIFQVIFSFIIAIWIMLKRKKLIITA